MTDADDIHTAWRKVQQALEAMDTAQEEDREEYQRLLGALMGLKMALEIEETLGDEW